MSEEGCPDPIFEMGPNSLTCTLPAHPRHVMMRHRRAIERDIVLGNFKEASVKVRELLSRDPYDARTIELFCEVCGLTAAMDSVYDFAKDLQIERLGGSTQLILAETLASIPQQTEPTRDLARRLLQSGLGGYFREALRRASWWLVLERSERTEKAIEVNNRLFATNPALRNSFPRCCKFAASLTLILQSAARRLPEILILQLVLKHEHGKSVGAIWARPSATFRARSTT